MVKGAMKPKKGRGEAAQLVTEKAREIWNEMDANQQTAVRIGMFPAAIMRRAEAEGWDGHELCIRLMDCAAMDGGMIA